MFEIYLLRAMSLAIIAFVVYLFWRAVEGRKTAQQATALAQDIAAHDRRINAQKAASERLQEMRRAGDDAKFDRLLQDIGWVGPREVVTK